ncbi:MAG TPA: cobalamin biosynthesis protein [Jatrophihabitantaceae bacterium]|nr:cobalamin biosynthesis protein [Jatrophihabitantaceae bacterium]
MRDRWSVAAGLVAGAMADALAGDPRRGHPVAIFGRAAGLADQRMWADSRARGAAYTAACVGAVAALGGGVERVAHDRPVLRATVVAAATWAVLGARSLRDEATALHALLADGDLPAARQQLTHLVGRDPSGLDATQIARAGVESLAENSSDAVVAPLLWGAVLGVPGLVGYRAVNTLDAMVGHHTPRYENFGWASARLDDAANLVPARLTAALVALLSGRPRKVWQVVRRDSRSHPSPNGGWCEAAFAAALGVRLGGRNVYAGRVEHRPQLGTGRPAAADDLPRAARLARRVGAAATLVAAAVAVLRPRG